MKMILTDIIRTLYTQLLPALILTGLFTAVYIFGKMLGWKNLLKTWWKTFKCYSQFRKVCLLSFYISLVLLKTLLIREIYPNPLQIAFNDLQIYDPENGLKLQVVENVILFIPLNILLLWTFKDEILKRVCIINVLKCSIKSALLFSLFIEVSQAVFHLGTLQLSDLLYNTLGGVLGGIIYWIIYRIINCLTMNIKKKI